MLRIVLKINIMLTFSYKYEIVVNIYESSVYSALEKKYISTSNFQTTTNE